jgi:hypothetical protein
MGKYDCLSWVERQSPSTYEETGRYSFNLYKIDSIIILHFLSFPSIALFRLIGAVAVEKLN